MTSGGRLERGLELVLFVSRWLLAPLYVGMIVALGLILVVFFHELIIVLAHIDTLDGEAVIVLALSLIDLSLTANLLLIVMFSGYENFVSKINTENAEDRPGWMGTLDFSGLKMKLIGSIVAISAISLLRAFMTLTDQATPLDAPRLHWMIILHLTFVGSGLLFAAMDYVGNRAEKPKEH